MFEAKQRVGRLALQLERALQHQPHGRCGRRLVAQPLQELDDERRRETSSLLGLGGEQAVKIVGRHAGRPGQRAFPPARLFPAAPRRHDAVDQTPQLLDETEPQHDRNRPGLADRQRSRPLIRRREIDQRVEIEAPRGVGDQLAGDHVDARIARVLALGQLRQLDIELPWQIPPDFPDLILHHVIVVAEPVLGRNRLRIAARNGGQELVRRLEAIPALVEARQQRPRSAWVVRERMRGGERLRVRLELLLGEER